MTFATRPTVGWAVQLPITQWVPQSHLPSQIMCTLLKANYKFTLYHIIAISKFKIIFNKGGCFIYILSMYSCHNRL